MMYSSKKKKVILPRETHGHVDTHYLTFSDSNLYADGSGFVLITMAMELEYEFVCRLHGKDNRKEAKRHCLRAALPSVHLLFPTDLTCQIFYNPQAVLNNRSGWNNGDLLE